MAGRKSRASAWKNIFHNPDEQFTLKREALLHQAAHAFSLHGYHNTSLDDVASALGVTKPALYYYVRSKQEILVECYNMALDLGDLAIERARSEGHSGLERLTLVVVGYIELLTSRLSGGTVLREYDALDPGPRKIILARRDAFDRQCRALIEEGIADGSIRAVNPKLTVFFFMGAVNWMTRWYSSEGELAGTEIAQAFADLLARGVGANNSPLADGVGSPPKSRRAKRA